MAVPKRKKTYLKSHRNYKNTINPKLITIFKMVLVMYNSYLNISWLEIFKHMNYERYQFKEINLYLNFKKNYFI